MAVSVLILVLFHLLLVIPSAYGAFSSSVSPRNVMRSGSSFSRRPWATYSEAKFFGLTRMTHCDQDTQSFDEEAEPADVRLGSRRGVLSSAALALFAAPEFALAKEDPLFKPNPLTNPVLEKIRIWEQAEADDIKYGGELAPGSPKGRQTYAKLLVPILQVQSDLDTLYELVHKENGDGLQQAAQLMEDRPELSQKIVFKKTFNAFADNIYYSDPDRANMYLGGGATPRNEQSIAYLLRNDILTNVEALQAEIAYLIKEKKNGADFLETEDLFKYISDARQSMVKYLDLVPPSERKLGEELFSAQRT